MFTPEEYEFYHVQSDRALNGELVLNDVSCPIEEMDPAEYYHDGNDAYFKDFTNVCIFSNIDGNIEYGIDIFPDRIEFEYCGDNKTERRVRTFSTELFSTLSDEEWFQVGTVQDLSFVEESLMRKFIKLSLMARVNLNNRES